jgi:hypothetical protein
MSDLGNTLGSIIAMLLIMVWYFTPTIIAVARKHPQIAAITVINVLAGWTFVGWIVALVWSWAAFQPRSLPPRSLKYH